MVGLRDVFVRHRAAAGALLCCLLLGVAAGALSFALQPDTKGSLGPGSVTIDVGLRASDTNLDLPPLGRLVADTEPIAIKPGTKFMSVPRHITPGRR